MATYKDDLDIIAAAKGDTSKLTLNAITELDNAGLLDRYSGDGGTEPDSGIKPVTVTLKTTDSANQYTLMDYFNTNKKYISYIDVPRSTYPKGYVASTASTRVVTYDSPLIIENFVAPVLVTMSSEFNTEDYTLEGDVVIIESLTKQFYITGDCTITLSPVSQPE